MGLRTQHVDEHYAAYDHGVEERHEHLAPHLLPGVLHVEASVGEALHHDGRGLHSDVTARASDEGDEDGQCRDGRYLGFEAGKDDGVDDTADDSYQQPGYARLCLGEHGVAGIDVGGDTRSQLIVAFRLLTHLVHDVVDGDLAGEPAYGVYHGHGHEVVFLEVDGHLIYRSIRMHLHRVGLHHVLYLRHRRVGDHLLQRKDTLEAVVVVDHIYIIYLVEVCGLPAHFLKALRHRPVLVDGYVFGAHEAAGGVFGVVEEVDDVGGLLHVIDMLDHLLPIFLIEFLDEVDGVVGVEFVDKLADLLRLHVLDEFLTVFLVKLHKHVGFLLLIVYKVEEPLGLLQVELAQEFGDVGRMKVGYLMAYSGSVLAVGHILYSFDVFFSEILHTSMVKSF